MKETMPQARIFAWAILAGVWLAAANQAGATSAAQTAEILGISIDKTSHSVSGERWVDETRKKLHKLTEEINLPDLIKLGTPAYHHIMNLAERGESFNVPPELVAGELSKVVECGGTKPRFDGKGERYARRTILEASSYLPTLMIERIPAIDARTVVGRGLFRKYASGRTLIKTNGVKTSLHELGHALEYSIDHLFRLRNEFYEERTRGKNLKNLHCALLPFGYRPDEKYKTGFVDRYMGKEGGAEVYSCGVEYVFFNRRDIWHRDPEVTKFILGSLIFYGGAISYQFEIKGLKLE